MMTNNANDIQREIKIKGQKLDAVISLDISYKDYVTNEKFRRMIQAATGEYDELLTLETKKV